MYKQVALDTEYLLTFWTAGADAPGVSTQQPAQASVSDDESLFPRSLVRERYGGETWQYATRVKLEVQQLHCVGMSVVLA